MFKKTKLTRLGEILISKGLITHEQLAIATQEQVRRRELLQPTDLSSPRTALIGEILVEFGFIDQQQLKFGLSWQERLRHASLAMALCAPFAFMISAPAASASVTTSSSSSSSVASPNLNTVTFQAENYESMSGVWNQNTDDLGGGQNIVNFGPGDWMSFSNRAISVPATGSYTITYRVATTNSNSLFYLNEASDGTVLDKVSLPNTGGWQAWVDVKRTVILTEGIHSFKLTSISGNANINWFKIDNVTLASDAPTSNLPLTIQSESYADMFGVWNQVTDDVGGGQNIVNFGTGDWLSYENTPVLIPSTGNYKVTYRVAATNSSSTFTLREASNNTVLDTITAPNTGGWQTWKDVTRIVNLTKGAHSFKLYSASGNLNVNWFKIEVAPPQAEVNTASSSSSSSVAPPSTSTNTSNTASTSTGTVTETTPNGDIVTTVAGSLVLSWLTPTKRENGNILDISEVGGYKIRYKLKDARDYTYITINDAWTNQYYFTWLEGKYIFQISAFDKNGHSSSFTDIIPK